MYMRPFTTSRMITVRLPPPVLPGGISGSTSSHSSSVRSLGYRNLLRSYRPRFLLVHIGDLSSNQATTLESQMIHMIQELFGQTLRPKIGGPCGAGQCLRRLLSACLFDFGHYRRHVDFRLCLIACCSNVIESRPETVDPDGSL